MKNHWIRRKEKALKSHPQVLVLPQPNTLTSVAAHCQSQGLKAIKLTTPGTRNGSFKIIILLQGQMQSLIV